MDDGIISSSRDGSRTASKIRAAHNSRNPISKIMEGRNEGDESLRGQIEDAIRGKTANLISLSSGRVVWGREFASNAPNQSNQRSSAVRFSYFNLRAISAVIRSSSSMISSSRSSPAACMAPIGSFLNQSAFFFEAFSHFCNLPSTLSSSPIKGSGCSSCSRFFFLLAKSASSL